MSENLKPCPFCGGEPQMVSTAHSHYVRCMECEQQFEQGAAAMAAEVWNRRVMTDEIVKPLCAHRFKLSFNKVGNCTSLGNFAEELDGQWVWLIDATNGMNDPLFTTPNTTLDEQERGA